MKELSKDLTNIIMQLDESAKGIEKKIKTMSSLLKGMQKKGFITVINALLSNIDPNYGSKDFYLDDEKNVVVSIGQLGAKINRDGDIIVISPALLGDRSLLSALKKEAEDNGIKIV